MFSSLPGFGHYRVKVIPLGGLLNIDITAGGELAAAESRGLKANDSGLGDSSVSVQQPAQDRGSSERAAGPDTAHEVQQPLLSQGSRHGGTAEAADKEGEAGSGGAEQALEEEQARVDAEGGEGGGAGRAAAEPLSWATRPRAEAVHPGQR